MKRRVVITAITLSVIVVIGVLALDQYHMSQFIILEKEYPGSLSGTFLREDEAMTVAKRAMQESGYSSHVPEPDDRSQAPDGTKDRYLGRNANDPHLGTVMFRDMKRQDWYRDLFVHIEKRGDRAKVIVVRGK